MATYRIATPAVQDLDELWDYHSSVTSVDFADRQINQLCEHFQLLGRYPHLGQARPEFDPEIRSHVVAKTVTLSSIFGEATALKSRV